MRNSIGPITRPLRTRIQIALRGLAYSDSRSPAEIARTADVSKSTLSDALNGMTYPNTETVIKLAGAFGLTERQFLHVVWNIDDAMTEQEAGILARFTTLSEANQDQMLRAMEYASDADNEDVSPEKLLGLFPPVKE